jgi:hypothetical protein
MQPTPNEAGPASLLLKINTVKLKSIMALYIFILLAAQVGGIVTATVRAQIYFWTLFPGLQI